MIPNSFLGFIKPSERGSVYVYGRGAVS